MEIEKIIIAENNEKTIQLFWEESNKENEKIWIFVYI